MTTKSKAPLLLLLLLLPTALHVIVTRGLRRFTPVWVVAREKTCGCARTLCGQRRRHSLHECVSPVSVQGGGGGAVVGGWMGDVGLIRRIRRRKWEINEDEIVDIATACSLALERVCPPSRSKLPLHHRKCSHILSTSTSHQQRCPRSSVRRWGRRFAEMGEFHHLLSSSYAAWQRGIDELTAEPNVVGGNSPPSFHFISLFFYAVLLLILLSSSSSPPAASCNHLIVAFFFFFLMSSVIRLFCHLSSSKIDATAGLKGWLLLFWRVGTRRHPPPPPLHFGVMSLDDYWLSRGQGGETYQEAGPS